MVFQMNNKYKSSLYFFISNIQHHQTVSQSNVCFNYYIFRWIKFVFQEIHSNFQLPTISSETKYSIPYHPYQLLRLLSSIIIKTIKYSKCVCVLLLQPKIIIIICCCCFFFRNNFFLYICRWCECLRKLPKIYWISYLIWLLFRFNSHKFSFRNEFNFNKCSMFANQIFFPCLFFFIWNRFIVSNGSFNVRCLFLPFVGRWQVCYVNRY